MLNTVEVYYTANKISPALCGVYFIVGKSWRLNPGSERVRLQAKGRRQYAGEHLRMSAVERAAQSEVEDNPYLSAILIKKTLG